MTSNSSKRSKHPSFPSTLAKFGYGWSEAGQMRKLGPDGKLTEQEFQFEVAPGDKDYNQAHYEALGGEVIIEEVYNLLEEKGNGRPGAQGS